MKNFCLSLLIINTLLFSVNSLLSTAISPPINTIQQLENNSNSQLNFVTNEIQIIGDEILFSENLQNQLETEILEAQK
ncbi:hypothetical protein H6G06_19600 [Anabaena sphaerica FACHB-251]|uniref:Uncharacterized protein n=1 Tax=Anabaena sphaerica FACHB-251 TaxID=2692883 RepID=A0A926WM09_9NOST|nr:hypothetical protein [Anabaena sphaerica]MBD2295618.1 hypothetical protein [Anabaena sphaerica FACHB-251]